MPTRNLHPLWMGLWLLPLAAGAAAAQQAGPGPDPVDVEEDVLGTQADQTPPAIQLEHPLHLDEVKGTVLVRAKAVDESGVTAVRFLLYGTSIGPLDTEPPFEVAWDTTTAFDGPHALRALAYDPSGNVGFTPSAWVKVQNDPKPARVRFATYLGRMEKDSARDVTVDKAGFVYMTGGTASPDFPASAGSYDTSYNGVHDVWVAKFDPNGKPVFATLIGGASYDRAYAIQVDDLGNIYVAGRAGVGFPTTQGVLQPHFGGDLIGSQNYGEQDGFVLKLSADGSQLLWSTYFGGAGNGVVRDIAVDDGGEVYVALTRAAFPIPHVTPGAFQTTLEGPTDAFLAKLSADGTQVRFGTYLGGSDDDGGTPSVRVDPQGRPVLLTHVRSSDVPTTPGAHQKKLGGEIDLYLARFSPDGKQLVSGTYFGGTGLDFSETHGLALDKAGNAFVAGTTTSDDLPFAPANLPGSFQRFHAGSVAGGGGGSSNYPGDGVAARFDDQGALTAFTYLGGSGGEGIEGVRVDLAGNLTVTGGTSSDDFPVSADAIQATRAGQGDVFVARLDADLTSLRFGTYWGGSGNDVARSMALAESGSVLCAGMTSSPDLPLPSGAFDKTFAGTTDALLLRIDL